MLYPVTAANLCRACATNIGVNHQEEAFKQFRKYQHLYSTLTELKVYDDDDLPKLLCTTCVGLLDTIENFKEACARSVDSIRKLIIANLKEEPMVEIVSAEALGPILKIENEHNDDSTENKMTFLAKLPNSERPICDLCGKTFVNVKGIRKHMKLELKHRLAQKDNKNLRKAKPFDRNIFCAQENCGQNFKGWKQFKKHMKMHEDSKLPTYCSICDRNYQGFGFYRRHMEVFHKATGTSNLVCPTCQKTFKTAYKLKSHILQKHIEETKTYDCATCGVRYVSECELKMHTNRHHQPGKNVNYICHFCEEIRNTKRAMREHIFKKHVTPPYVPCNICNSQVVASRMTLHLISRHFVRSDLQILKCKICDKEFKRNVMLNRHMKIHSGVRPYVCHLCGMAFIRPACLKRHFYSHSGERPVHCDHCGKGLYSREALKIHMNIHKREWIAQGQTGIELLVYATSNKSKNSTEKKYANMK